MRKKLGTSYTEVLIAISIFLVGVIPLLASLNSSFEATIYNKNFTKALEYNRQLMEEISSYLPIEVSGYDDLEDIYDEIEEMCEARSESSAKGIYKIPDWDGSDFDFDKDSDSDGIKDKLVDDSMYRTVEVGSFTEGTDESFDVTVTSYLTRNNEYIAKSILKINLVDETSE
ncbi:hypothetical protein [uncultured Ilyobacter sp.]|uniref:type IV pilus modification PilV family protein n=1 Tax=uncultured Ilyobacter sp. TaxID=544433 RepID=UPI0029C0373B|nr:hypothetical protein [uncultured Ilyobacter sp.]